MDKNSEETNLEENIKQVMQSLPPVIRDYIARGEYTVVAKGLMAKYALRIDQGGILEREIMFLLLGIDNPYEFTQALAEEAHLDGQTITTIVQEVNDKIFIPLRKAEEQTNEAPIAREPMKPITPPIAPRLMNTSGTMSAVQPPIASDNPIVAPLPPKMVMPQSTATLGDVIRSVLPPEKPLDGGVNVLPPREEKPRFEYRAPLTPAPVPPAVSTNPPVPTLVPPPSPEPTLEFHKVEPRVEPPVVRPASAPLKSYSSSDPYREPIDEPPTV